MGSWYNLDWMHRTWRFGMIPGMEMLVFASPKIFTFDKTMEWIKITIQSSPDVHDVSHGFF